MRPRETGGRARAGPRAVRAARSSPARVPGAGRVPPIELDRGSGVEGRLLRGIRQARAGPLWDSLEEDRVLQPVSRPGGKGEAHARGHGLEAELDPLAHPAPVAGAKAAPDDHPA